ALALQSRQFPHPAVVGTTAPLARGDPGDAPGASFDPPRGDRQQFRVQFAVVGPPVSHLPRRARRWTSDDDDRHPAVSRSEGAAARPAALAAISRLETAQWPR